MVNHDFRMPHIYKLTTSQFGVCCSQLLGTRAN